MLTRLSHTRSRHLSQRKIHNRPHGSPSAHRLSSTPALDPTSGRRPFSRLSTRPIARYRPTLLYIRYNLPHARAGAPLLQRCMYNSQAAFDKVEKETTNTTMSFDDYKFPDDRLKTKMDDPTKTPLLLVACGSFSPITYLHMRMFAMASDYVKHNGQFELVGGYLSPVSDAYKKQGLAAAEHRYDYIVKSHFESIANISPESTCANLQLKATQNH